MNTMLKYVQFCDLTKSIWNVFVCLAVVLLFTGDGKKNTSGDISSQERKLSEEILKEATTMIRFQHPNIVRLLGVCCQYVPWLCIVALTSRFVHSLLRVYCRVK